MQNLHADLSKYTMEQTVERYVCEPFAAAIARPRRRTVISGGAHHCTHRTRISP